MAAFFNDYDQDSQIYIRGLRTVHKVQPKARRDKGIQHFLKEKLLIELFPIMSEEADASPSLQTHTGNTLAHEQADKRSIV
jgi:hypothetical protein